jgi:alkanesulfonate monooxygenase SsuD/methylene tetrahydromethanopterin reductase-like flavin-dependent oxidoreductase (luciferase family)
MKVSVFSQVPYRQLADDYEQHHESVVTPPWDIVEPDELRASFRDSLDQLVHGARRGFDGVAFTEHAQTVWDMAPNPSLIGAAVGYATETEGLDVAICALGRSLGKAREPVRVAEEYAMLDCISGGRLLAGFPVGLAYDANVNNGVPPIETRARFDENLPLVLRAWSDPKPFAHNGKFSQYPSVNIWPRPLQQRPPVWITGIGNPATMQFTLDNGFGFNYFGMFGVKETGKRIFDRFWEIAEKSGHEKNPYRAGIMQAVCVGETDEEARRIYGKHVEVYFRQMIGGISMERLAMPGGIGLPGLQAIMRDPGDFGMYQRLRTATLDDLIEAGCVVLGSAETVAEQLSRIVDECGVGHFLAMLQVGSMPRDLTMENIDRFADGVLPHLRSIYADDAIDNHWWPERLGGTPTDVAGQKTHQLAEV